MDLLSQYESLSEDDENCGAEVESSSEDDGLKLNQPRSVYLITYSQADLSVVPNRQAFADLVLEAVNNNHASEVHWVCAKERHKSGRKADGSGIHFHLAIKINKVKRWNPIRRYILETWSINVHFSNKHSNYYTAWAYVTKEDECYLESPNHPDLKNEGPPRTMNASQALLDRTRGLESQETVSEQDTSCSGGSDEESRPRQPVKKSRHSRLSVFDVSEIAVGKGIKTRTELLALANGQKQEGKTDLAEFISNRGPKAVAEAISTGWEMAEAKNKLERNKMSRLELLEKASEGNCANECNGDWLICAQEVLDWNGISQQTFAQAVTSLLAEGRGKFRNLLLIGPANTAKTFLLQPLTVIYNAFSNPATATFAWVGAEQSEVIFLNDFRWSPQIIPWHDLLLMLEGQPVHLPAPKSHFCKDIVFDSDTPIFSTSKHELVYVRGGAIDETETQMMQVRWRIFHFYRQISQANQRKIPPCGKCFARLVHNERRVNSRDEQE